MSDYDTDILLWSERQADLLRRIDAGERVNDQVDWKHIAEEIEAFGKAQSRELASRIATILLHLIKLEASPARAPRSGWRDTIAEQRDEIERLLADAPSLRPTIPHVIVNELARAKHRAAVALAGHGEQPRVDPGSLGYSADQVVGDWFPHGP